MTLQTQIVKQTIFSIAAAAVVFTGVIAASSSANAAGYSAGYYARVVNVSFNDALNMRKWPAPYSRHVGTIRSNKRGVWVQRCIIKRGASDWCKVKSGRRWGWVNSRYIQFTNY